MTASMPIRVKRWVVRFGALGITPTIEQDDSRTWTLTIPPEMLPEDSAFGVTFTQRRNKRMRTDIELVLEGEKENPKDLLKALGMLAKTIGSKDKPSITKENQSARSNSVETRRATVIRV